MTYTGKTTPAEITADNATSLTLSAYDTGSVGSNASPLGVQSQTQNQTAIADAASLTRIAKDIAQKAKSSTSTSAAGAWVEMGSFPGDCGGNVVFSYDDVTLDSSFAFNSYCDAASAMTFTGQLTMTMGDTATINVSMNLSIRENATGVVYRLQDYNAIITDVYDTTTDSRP